jgi:hypothetical protein
MFCHQMKAELQRKQIKYDRTTLINDGRQLTIDVSFAVRNETALLTCKNYVSRQGP